MYLRRKPVYAYNISMKTCHMHVHDIIIMMIMIKVLGKGRACIPEGLIKAYDVYINFTKYVLKVGERRKNL